MHLIVFDLDGTLLQSVGVDNDCFVAAVKEAWGLSEVSTDWASYSDATDQAIACDLYRMQFGRDPEPHNVVSLKQVFERRLREELARPNVDIAVMPGADELLDAARLGTHFRAAIATGSWRGPMLVKSTKAGLQIEDVPSATADEAVWRVDIIRTAIARASRLYDIGEWNSITYVGDGVWDYRSASELELPFIGVARGEEADRLRRTGAEVVLSDLTGLLAAAGFADDRPSRS